MATYEFVCAKCETEFEVTCHMDEREAKAVCPRCGSHEVKQVFTAEFASPPPDKY
jgi:putative FmdB family regulatory protein